MLFDSVSKRYSECGIRIGCLCTKNKQVRDAVMKFCQARLSPPLLGQVVAEATLDVQKEYLHAVYEEYLERRNFLIDGLNKIPGVYSPIPMGAFYTMAKLPVDDAEKFCIWCLRDFQYEGATVMMAPGAGFYTEPGEGRQEVRIAYVLCKEDLARALEHEALIEPYILLKARGVGIGPLPLVDMETAETLPRVLHDLEDARDILRSCRSVCHGLDELFAPLVPLKLMH